MKRIYAAQLIALVAYGTACGDPKPIEFRRIAPERDECVACEVFEYTVSVDRTENLFVPIQPGLVLGAQDVDVVSIWRSTKYGDRWIVSIDLAEDQSTEWLKYIADLDGERVLVSVDDRVIAVLNASAMRFLVLSEFEDIHDVEKFLSDTNLNGKDVRIPDADIERAESRMRDRHPDLDTHLREADEIIRRAERELEIE